MYKLSCDGYPLLDLRDEELMVYSPKVKVEVNTIGEGSFTIYKNHPYYGKLLKKKSIFEVSDEVGVIFRGSMTSDTRDFNNGKAVDLEGLMAFFNDSIVPVYNFPEDFDVPDGQNVVEFFLGWLIENHNSQVQDWQKFKLGTVTVSDPNNYITRSDSTLPNTWEVLKKKLFESELGGYLCIRYEADGNYIDYLSEFTLYNTQDIDFGVNLIDLKHESDADEVFTAVIPVGAEIEEDTGETDDSGNAIKVKKKLTLENIADGAVTDDIYKVTLENGLHALYSKSAVEEYGWICAPVSDSTFKDITDVNNLLSKNVDLLNNQGILLSDTINITAADLHFTDEEIRSFRIYRKINVNSMPHNIEQSFDLTKLDIDLLNPQNTKITVGETKLTLTDQNNKEQSDNIEKIQEAFKDIEENRSETTEVKNQLLIQQTEIINTCEEIILGALETYVETGDFETYKQTVEAQLQILSDEISLRFEETTTHIEDVNGDLQETNTTLSKYFEFTLDGLVIKSGESEITLHIDNDIIMFKRNGEQFGWWDGVDFHTGNVVIEVTERAQFGNFAFVPRSDGSLSFLKIGDEGVRVISISASYSGGDVPSGTDVEDLTGITVTATYSDGSTAEVRGYTVSGTIEVGSNVITVSFMGKTSKITVVGYEAVTLSGISVVYTGGDVPVGTSVYDLKGITVTAEYSDGSTATVNDYTLEGNINEGSNNIYAWYGDYFASFTVTGVATGNGYVLGDAGEYAIALFMLSNSGATVQYADEIEVVDGALSLVSPSSTTFYTTTSSSGANNNYNALLGKYVKHSSSNAYYYIDPNSSYRQGKPTSGYANEYLWYTIAYPVSVAE